MSRLIDADKLYPDRMTNKGTVAISQSQIAKATTVQAVPIEVLQEIRQEIAQIKATQLYSTIDLKDMVLAIIDKHMEEHHD